ncbi:MAG: 3-phosphoadenosine 5-phosphosulfate 3-phosphatase [Deltaproteobacteria bacterium]|nr:3-phosphoadenosine 5-phosphosulfate 3-phosphatase [Deltaproteobacteria bacterium]
MSYQRELDVALSAARAAGEVVLRYYESDTGFWEKSKDNPLTLADLESDRVIGERLRAAFPGDAILSEETVDAPSRLANPRVWIVDPVDGTKEFTKRIPEFGVSIALTVMGEPVVGVILNPAAGTAVWASEGDGTFRDGTRVRVSSKTQLADALVIASRTEISRNQFEPYAGWFAELRPIGSIAWKLACIASGEGDLNISVAPKNEWDVCAGDLLVREAGGVYVAFDRTTRRYNQAKTLIDAGMAAGPAVLVDAFLARERARAV